MKKLMRKVSMMKGIRCSMKEFLDTTQSFEVEYCTDDGSGFVLVPSDVPTIKYKGKVIDANDIEITFEENNND